MNIETWKSNKGNEEIHHFVEGEPNKYLFGFNEQLLGAHTYSKVLRIVAMRVKELQNPVCRDWATAGDEQ